METKRSARLIMTNEARVLREMRMECSLSMRKAAGLLGLSDSYIAHLETGRLDVPKGEKLERLLSIYGGIKPKSFYERARNFRLKHGPREELVELVQRMDDQKITTLLTVAKGLAS